MSIHIMPDFSYIALGKDGHKEEAVISAANAAAAGRMLKEQGLLPTQIKEKATASSAFGSLANWSPISLNEKITFIQNLSVMLKAGIAVSRSLQILAKQSRNKRFQGILNDIYDQVESGKGLGEALAKHPTVFSNIFVSMVKVGELSGSLDKSLQYLSIQLQREASLKSKVKGAMMYPSVIVGAIVIVGILMSIYVLPSLTGIFKQSNMQLPITTQIVVAGSDFMSTHAALVMIGLVVFVGLFMAGLKTPGGKRALDWFALHMLIINGLAHQINLARLSRILSSLLKSGIPIVEALEVTGQALGNSYYADSVTKAAADVKLGKPLSESLGKAGTLYPPLIIQMLQVGEESGTTEGILDQLAGHFEEEVDTVLSNLSSIIEPLLLLVIGGVVGLLAVALISPIYNMQTSQ